MKQIRHYLYFSIYPFCTWVVLSLIVSSCASTGAPSGGPKDATPPKLDSIKSVRNFQTNYFPKQLDFYFDEFIEVRDAIKQVLVSPPTKYIPKVSHRGKKLTFRFDDREILRENATYTINFGESIVDYTEGNKLNNFSFVFSTGDVIDSLSLEGTVIDAITEKPEDGILVMLYDQKYDSVVVKEKPFYFVKTDKNGKFKFENIRNDTFRILALKDENLNYLYDLPAEKTAFSDIDYILTDSTDYQILLRASIAESTPKSLSVNKKDFGKVNILFSSLPENVNIQSLNPEVIIYKEIKLDSVNIYYNTEIDSFNLLAGKDTIQVKPRGKQAFLEKAKFKQTSSNLTFAMRTFDSLAIEFNHPIELLNADSIILFDSVGILDNKIVKLSENNKKLIIRSDDWREDKKYNLLFIPGSLTDIFGIKNDSIQLKFGLLNTSQLAGLDLTISGLDSTLHYVVKISTGGNLKFNFGLSDVKTHKQSFRSLIPEKYNVEIIEDKNRNGKWDPGDYWKKFQPENIKVSESEKLRANWDTEMIIRWGGSESNEPITPENGLNVKKE
ncbi:MAG: Ig-like domain-containing protein [Saprospiraceae bacterium]|nr:Ig-like domain-containing protein [Saprospiraceae bacterium]